MTCKILFVCMGNICRSPTAAGVFHALLVREGLERHVQIDSAGTHAYHVGNPPDVRAQRAARERGIDLSAMRARRIEQADFERFDHILVMDAQNQADVLAVCPPVHRPKVRLMLEYAPHLGVREVPDPYYGGMFGFERVLDLLEDAAEGFLEQLRRQPPD